jgi:hypothetical protein
MYGALTPLPPDSSLLYAKGKGQRVLGLSSHSPPSSTRVKNVWSFISTCPICLNGMVLRYKDDVTSECKKLSVANAIL